MYNWVSVEDALKAWEHKENSPALLVSGDLWVYGSQKAVERTQMYLLAQATQPDEREDVKNYLAYELKVADSTIAHLRAEIDRLNGELGTYKRYNRKFK